ncbi:hypothetical protein BZA77DRAFT_293741 [Pyronema omphalodes]|nr:hypothetical protein BZA77DRAFT_293741 [Pyronema omphalodes]
MQLPIVILSLLLPFTLAFPQPSTNLALSDDPSPSTLSEKEIFDLYNPLHVSDPSTLSNSTLGKRGDLRLPWSSDGSVLLTLCSSRDCDLFGSMKPFYAPPYQCIHLNGYWNDNIHAYKVENGCCAFYRHHNCKERLFTARNRHDSWLKAGHRGEISSFRH